MNEVDELARLRAIANDPAVWALGDIQAFLGQDRTVVYRLWRNTSNYLADCTQAWPPTVHSRVAEGDGPGATWWPPHESVLPPPDFDSDRARPRWRAGTIRSWALQVGRMLPDGTMVRPRGGRHARARSAPDAPAGQLEQLRALGADEQEWDSAQIREFFGVSEAQRKWWVTATINRFAGGETSWPPQAHERPVSGSGPGLRWWPPHHNLLPPPVAGEPGDGRANRYTDYRWRAGDVKLWGVQTRRLGPDGSLIGGGRGRRSG